MGSVKYSPEGSIALKIKPGFGIATNNIAMAEKKIAQWKLIITESNDVLKERPDDELACYSRGMAKYHTGDKKSARKDLKKALKPGNLNAHKALETYCR